MSEKNQSQRMVDQAKRSTLKKVTGISVGSAVLVSSTAIAGLATFIGTDSGADVSKRAAAPLEGPVTDLADIEVTTTVSSITNDLEIVLTNTGTESVAITDMTPAELHTARGKFDFNALVEQGSLELAAGEKVRVPLQHYSFEALTRDKLVAGSHVNLKKKLENTVSIITNGDSLAVVTVV